MNIDLNNLNFKELKNKYNTLFDEYKKEYNNKIKECAENMKLCYKCNKCDYCNLYKHICKLYFTIFALVSILNKIHFYKNYDKSIDYKEVINYFNNQENYEVYVKDIFNMLYDNYLN